jgi:hypothetical protein
MSCTGCKNGGWRCMQRTYRPENGQIFDVQTALAPFRLRQLPDDGDSLRGLHELTGGVSLPTPSFDDMCTRRKRAEGLRSSLPATSAAVRDSLTER